MSDIETNGKMPAPIRKVILSDATFTGADREFEPTFINFFYGRNGAGKSTIANTIKANNEDNVEWGDGHSADKYDVLVYNQDFIDKNFADYEDVPGVFTVCSDNKEKEEEAARKTEEKKKLEEKSETARVTLKDKTDYRDGLLGTLQDTLVTAIKPIRERFKDVADGTGRKDSLYRLLTESKKPTPVDHNPDDIQKIYDVAFKGTGVHYDSFERVSSTPTYGTLPGHDLLDQVIVSSGDTPFSQFMNALGASAWVREGHEHYLPNDEDKCPFCQQKMPKTFEADITASFDKQYQQNMTDIKAFQRAYETETSAILQKLKANLEDAMPTLDLTEYKDKLSLLESSVKINTERISGKVDKPTTVVSLEDTDSLLLEIGTLIDDINAKIKANNDVVDDIDNQKKLCKKQFQEYIAFVAKPYFDTYKANYTKADGEVTTAKDEKKKIDDDIRQLGIDIAELNKSIVNTTDTINKINETLRDTGFQGFRIQEREDIPNHYEIVRGDGTVVNKNLSEGERNFISFLYFYHLVRGSQSRTEVKDKIVIIDDPVSSMDSSSLFIVGSLVREMIDVCYNNTDYKGNTDLGDYIKQIFILTHNVYFHSEVTYKQEKNYRSTSFFKILKDENVSSVIPCVRPDPARPSEDENYNPVQNSYKALWTELKEAKSTIPALSVIRQILEYYFMQMCGRDRKKLRLEVLEGKHRDLFMIPGPEGGKPDPSKYHLADSMLRFISNPTGFGSEIHYVEERGDVEQYLKVFKLIFDAMEQSEHYKMMMELD